MKEAVMGRRRAPLSLLLVAGRQVCAFIVLRQQEPFEQATFLIVIFLWHFLGCIQIVTDSYKKNTKVAQNRDTAGAYVEKKYRYKTAVRKDRVIKLMRS